MAARYEENGRLSDVVPSLQEAGHRLAAVAGTSTCHIVQVCVFTLSKTSLHYLLILTYQSPHGIFVDGVWGPYKVCRFTFAPVDILYNSPIINRTPLSLDGG